MTAKPAAPGGIRQWKVICPRCRDSFWQDGSDELLREIIDKPCRNCRGVGVDAVEVACG